MPYPSAKHIYVAFLHLALLVLAVEVVVLGSQNKILKMGPGGPIADFKEGDFFSLAGLQPYAEGASCDTTKTQLIFLFSTACPHCQKSFPLWRAVDSLAHFGDYRLSLTSICTSPSGLTNDFVLKSNINFAVLEPTDAREFSMRNNIGLVPRFFIRSKEGRVVRIWKGELTQKQALQLEEAILEKSDSARSAKGGAFSN